MATDLQRAIRDAIATEKGMMDFYSICAKQVCDSAARRVFEVLASEEREHAGYFYKIYQGEDIPSLEAFLDAPPTDSLLASMSRDTGGTAFDAKRALELAMAKEQALQKSLLETAQTIADTDIRSVFELNARETGNHYQVIEAEYARLMGMVDESEMDTFVRE